MLNSIYLNIGYHLFYIKGLEWTKVNDLTIGSQYIDQVNINNKTLYASPYLVVNDREYTKHYYAGSQRITSKIGAGLAGSVVDPLQYQVQPINSTYQDKSDSLYQMLERGQTCANLDPDNVTIDPKLQSINNLYSASENDPEPDRYFYHTDHLGSSSWITDASGNVNQHLQPACRRGRYLPFGESFISQRVSSYDVRYKFTGKERDSETGFDYFGARYYDSDLSVWLSVDLLDFKYPSTSPYMYVGGHPTIITDPNGMDWYQDKDGNYNYDKNVNKDTKLGEGEKYLGKTYKIDVNGSDGKYSYSSNLNEDGSYSDTRGNSYTAGSGEFDPKFESGHKINNNTNKYPSFGGVMFYKEDGTLLYASGKGDKDIIYTVSDDKVDAVMKGINAYKEHWSHSHAEIGGKLSDPNYFQNIADKYSSNTYNTWVLNGTLWVYKNAPWYIYIAIPSITGCSAGLAEKYKNSGAIQNTDYGIDNTLHKFYDAQIFEIWW